MNDLFHDLQKALAQRPHKVFRWENVSLRPAAVLIPMYVKDNVPHVIFTQRPMTLRTHAGQISFPGGSLDPQDASLAHAALREAFEEIGLPPEKVNVLGRLDDIATPSLYRISPFVGLLEEEWPWTKSAEVEEVFSVPVPALMLPSVLRIETHSMMGQNFDVHYYSYQQRTIWGATGRILNDLLTLIAELPSAKELNP